MRARGTGALAIAFGVMVAAVALAHLGRGANVVVWDDALFFRRVAYNVLHHGIAAWNVADGPVFMNTSQLHQAIATLLLVVAPRHFDVAATVWAAACAFVMYATFARRLRRDLEASALAFAGLLAPPILSAIATGMYTCTVFVALALFLHVSSRAPSRHQPLVLAIMNAVVYVARPDAAVISMVIALGVLSAPSDERRRRVVAFTALALAMLLVISAAFRLYYGSALPLATFLKVSPVSVYDRAYLALDVPRKLTNLLQLGLLVAPLVPFVVARLDRTNVVLVAAGLAFVGFHAATTSEIMGYHARFYAPAWPVVVWAAARGATSVDTPRQRWSALIVAGSAGLLTLLAYQRGWIENATSGSELERAPAAFYLVYFLGVVLVGVLPFVREQARSVSVATAVALAVSVSSVTLQPRPFSLASDTAIYESVSARDANLVGLDTIRTCFTEPVQLTHSELGIAGVLLPESRIIDLTGLANPRVASRRFDFERLCEDDRPDFVFRPHRSHRVLNEAIAASPCLAARYTAARLPRASASPLFVRNDHVARFEACAERSAP